MSAGFFPKVDPDGLENIFTLMPHVAIDGRNAGLEAPEIHESRDERGRESPSEALVGFFLLNHNGGHGG